MCCLLRHPARVPALFSGATEPVPPRHRLPSWLRLGPADPARAATAWAAVVLTALPLLKAGMAAAGLALRG